MACWALWGTQRNWQRAWPWRQGEDKTFTRRHTMWKHCITSFSPGPSYLTIEMEGVDWVFRRTFQLSLSLPGKLSALPSIWTKLQGSAQALHPPSPLASIITHLPVEWPFKTQPSAICFFDKSPKVYNMWEGRAWIQMLCHYLSAGGLWALSISPNTSFFVFKTGIRPTVPSLVWRHRN